MASTTAALPTTILPRRSTFFSFSHSSLIPWSPRRPSMAFPARFRRRVLTVQAKVREIFMPALSSTMTEGKIVSWMKSEGDLVSKGESVVVVESDKADMDVETFYDGIIAAIVVPEGQTAPVGSPIAILAETEDDIPQAKANAIANSKSNPNSNPDSNLNSNSEVVVPIDVPAVAPVGNDPKKIVATPHAKKLAKKHVVDLNSVVGTGPFGRITPSDVESAAGIRVSPLATGASSVATPEPVNTSASLPSSPSFSSFSSFSTSPPSSAAVSGYTVVPFTTMQSAVSKNMVESLSVPTFRVGYPVITDALDSLYKKVKPKGVSMTALLAKAVAMALVEHPVINASCKDGKNFSYNSSINIAVAVAIDGGLITPVLQDADKLDLYLLSQKWKELVEKARAKQLQPKEYNSGTFTLSNLGMFGVDKFDAILPSGQGAIMAVGASRPIVVADANGFFSVKKEMVVNVTADHRIIYGADLAAFLRTFSDILVHNPDTLTIF